MGIFFLPWLLTTRSSSIAGIPSMHRPKDPSSAATSISCDVLGDAQPTLQSDYADGGLSGFRRSHHLRTTSGGSCSGTA